MKVKTHVTLPSLYALLVFIMVYFSHDTLLFGTNADAAFIAVRKAMPFAVALGLLATGRLHRFRLRDAVFVGAVMLLPFGACFLYGEPFNNYVYRAAIMGTGALFVFMGKKYEFAKSFNAVMSFLTASSLVVWLLSYIAPNLITALPQVESIGKAVYYNAFVSVVPAHQLESGLLRNFCIFREPGVFVVLLTVAMLFELVVLPRARAGRLALFTVGILSTLSTAGYIILAFIYAYVLLVHIRMKYRPLLAILLLVVVLCLASFTNVLSADGIVFEKFDEDSNRYGSWLSRQSSVVVNLEIALQNPLFGIGRYALYDKMLQVVENIEVVDNTNTVLIGFAAFGFPFGLLVTAGLWCFLKRHQASSLTTLLLFVILFAALSNEDMGQNVLYYVLVFTGLFHESSQKAAPLQQNPCAGSAPHTVPPPLTEVQDDV